MARPSDRVLKGDACAPQRSLFYALGLTEEELSRPLIGVVSSWNEIIPGHMNLDKIAQAVKMGVAMAGGTPIIVPAIAVCDGIAMGHIGMKYSLVTRDLIADSTEAVALAHQFDGPVVLILCTNNICPCILQQRPSVFVLFPIPTQVHLADILNQVAVMGNKNGISIGLQSIFQESSRCVLPMLRLS